MTKEQMAENYPNCVAKELVYLDNHGVPRLKERQLCESLTYEDCVSIEFNYGIDFRRNKPINVAGIEAFLAKSRGL